MNGPALRPPGPDSFRLVVSVPTELPSLFSSGVWPRPLRLDACPGTTYTALRPFDTKFEQSSQNKRAYLTDYICVDCLTLLKYEWYTISCLDIWYWPCPVCSSTVPSVVAVVTERTAPNSLPRCMSGVSMDMNVAYNMSGLGSMCCNDGTPIAIDLIKVHSESIVDGMLNHSCTDIVSGKATDKVRE